VDRAASRLVLADAGLLTAFRIFDPRGFLGLTDNDLPKYGSNQFTMLIQHFCKSTSLIKLFAIESTEKYRLILAEFQNYKKIMFKLVRENKIISMRAAWCHIKQFHADELPHILMIVYVLMVLPVQTAVVERGFSLHRIIKNRLRSRLLISKMDSLMRVSMGARGPLNAFDIGAACTVYQSKSVAGQLPSLLLGRLHSLVNKQNFPRDLEDAFDGSDDELDIDNDALEGDDAEDLDEDDGVGEEMMLADDFLLPEEVVADSDNEIDDEDMQSREDAAAAAPMEIGDDDDEVAALFGAL